MQSMDHSEDLTPIQNPAQSESHQSGSTLNKVKSTVADKLHQAAAAIRQKAGQNSTAAGYANQASDLLDHTAEYVRDIEPAQIKSDIQQKVRNNPGRSLLIAGAAGLALGILLRRR